jgi:hypothetical protein
MTDNERFFVTYEMLKDHGLINSYVELATVLGTNKAGINDLKQGKKKLSIDNVRSMKKSYHQVSIDYLLDEIGEPLIDKSIESEPVQPQIIGTGRKLAMQAIPLYSTYAAAGLTQVFSDTHNVMEHISIPNMPKCDGAIHITGDSMYPLLKSGDIVAYKVVKDILHGIMWGEMYLITFMVDDDYYTMVKYIQKSDKGDDYIKLVSQNQHHQPKDIPISKVTALARIKATIRFN